MHARSRSHLGAILSLGLSAFFAAPAVAQSLQSDQPDYAPGSTAVLLGSGFAPNENVTLQVLHADGTPDTGQDHQPWIVAANEDGFVVTSWHVCEDDCVGAILRATAVGASSNSTASTTFTDGSPSGGGVVTSVIPVGNDCVATTSGNNVFDYEVAPGGTYVMTITGVTECTGDTITVFVQCSSTGNFCFNATGGPGAYSGQF